MSESVKLLSVNVRGLSRFKKRRAIFISCQKWNEDLIFLQETHSTVEHETSWRHEWGAEIISAPGTCDARRVAVLFDKKGGILTPRKAIISCIGCSQNELDLIDI